MEDRTIHTLPAYQGEIGLWVWCLEDTRKRTLLILQGISQDELDWQADSEANTIGSLLYHIAAIEMSYVFEDLLAGSQFPDDLEFLLPQDVRRLDGSLANVTGEALTDHLKRLESCRKLLEEVYQNLKPDKFHKPVRLDVKKISPAWILHHLMQHEAEHRGQIEEIRRMYARAYPPQA